MTRRMVMIDAEENGQQIREIRMECVRLAAPQNTVRALDEQEAKTIVERAKTLESYVLGAPVPPESSPDIDPSTPKLFRLNYGISLLRAGHGIRRASWQAGNIIWPDDDTAEISVEAMLADDWECVPKKERPL